MKKIFTLLFAIVLFSTVTSAQLLLTDDFNYSGLLTANGWTQTALEAGDPISTTTPGLTFPGYPNSGVGNAATLTGTLQDVTRGFTKQTAAGTTIWMSAMVNVTEATNISGNGVNFLHLGDRDDATPSTFNNFAGRIYVKANANGVFFGASNTSSSFYSPTRTVGFARNTTYLLVLKLTFQPAAVSDLKLWVFESGTPSTEADLGTPEIDNPGTVGTITEIDAVALRQASSLPDLIVDGIRVSNNYQQISLPLSLTSFKGSLAEKSVNLSWTSANEVNVKDFTVERSNDARSFISIGTVNATNRVEASYAFTDNNPLAGANYYRLKMNDKDGASKYSSIAVINNRNSVTVQLFPSPTLGSLNVSHPKATSGASIKVLSLDGRVIQALRVQAGAMQTSISAAGLTAGNYLLMYESNGERSVTKFVKQ